MGRALLTVFALAWLGTGFIAAQQSAGPAMPTESGLPDGLPPAAAQPLPASEGPAPVCDVASPPAPPPWQPAWGLAALRIIAAGPKVAPNGEEYHPLFSIDMDLNLWLWRAQRIYLFSDIRFWGEKAENGVTNERDGSLGFSKRQFDITGGPAWNYAGNWEARVFGYSLNNLNRGLNLVTPYGHNDGFGVENRYYLSQEYAKLGQSGFDVARADFVSIGYYPTKTMVGNDGNWFEPGLLLRGYLTRNLWDWPAYAFGDVTYISERSMHPKLLLFDVGVAARPLAINRQWEFRLGVENTGDFETHSVLNLWYVSLRYIF